MSRRRVDLPQPLGPITETNSPQSTRRFTLLSAFRGRLPRSKTWVRPSMATCPLVGEVASPVGAVEGFCIGESCWGVTFGLSCRQDLPKGAAPYSIMHDRPRANEALTANVIPVERGRPASQRPVDGRCRIDTAIASRRDACP